MDTTQDADYYQRIINELENDITAKNEKIGELEYQIQSRDSIIDDLKDLITGTASEMTASLRRII